MELKDVAGFNGIYRINENGEIYSVGRRIEKGKHSGFYPTKKLKYKYTIHGYRYVSLYKNGEYKNSPIHRLVALNYLPNPMKLPCVNHIDGDKLNNHISNLEWCTQKHNLQHAFKTGLTPYMPKNHVAMSAPIIAKNLTGEVVLEFPSMMQAKREKGFNPSNICNSIKNKRLGYGFYWEYKID